MARASGVALRFDAGAVPLLSRAMALCEQGFVTGASGRNWESYGAGVRWAAGLGMTMRDLLTDAQTSGGLLVACDAGAVADVVGRARADGCVSAGVVGTVEAGSGVVVGAG